LESVSNFFWLGGEFQGLVHHVHSSQGDIEADRAARI
jgi:hypothetical protein